MRITISILLAIFFAFSAFADERPFTKIEKYLEGTDYELHVYTIKGRRDGNTMLILGGIQGDEPGGYLSADLYANLQLEQGNLIIIPRGSLKSVILFNRGIDGDMNRLFVDDLKQDDMSEKVVAIIMEYMKEADIFLNLHDGWGFHDEKYVNTNRNPSKFGQSIIVDADTYKCENDKVLDLEAMAKVVLAEVNSKIPNKDHHLAYFNTKTGDADTKFKDMRKTATWYALRKHCIPAFGIESSKNLETLELKILYHNYAINEFMKISGIVPEIPPVYVIPAVFNNATILVNGESYTLRNGDSLEIDKGDVVKIIHIESNHQRGVSCDIIGHGNYNDFNKEVAVQHSTKILFRKENEKFAEVNLNIKGSAVVENTYQLNLLVNNEKKTLKNGDHIAVKVGSTIKVVSVELGGKSTGLPINVRGWVSPEVAVNNGDDRGYDIKIAPQDFIKRFSLDGKGNTYPITVDSNKKEVLRVFLDIK